MLLRIASGVILIPLVIALVWWGQLPLVTGAAAIVALLALNEFFNLGERQAMRAYRRWTFLCVALAFYAQFSQTNLETHSLSASVSIVRNAAGGVLSLDAVLLVFLFGCVAIGIATRRALGEVLPSIGISSAGMLFIALPLSYLVRTDEIQPAGRQLVLFTLAIIWAGDTLAYFVGHLFGHVPMAPALSPKKTWEGALANLIGSLLVAVFFARWMQADAVTMLIVAGLGNIAGQMGDLIESAYKRGAGVKDSGSLIPGHGGVLDRIDALILASPVVWAAYHFLASWV
jgi:phosphatidate cytidylyltransferase